MQPAVLVGDLLGAVTARVDRGSDAWQPSLASARSAYSALGGTGWCVLVLVSLLALAGVGGVAGRVARQLARRSTPELIVLLNESAAFYGRWPEDRLASVPRAELVAEAARCQRIIELLERREAAGVDGGPASRGPIDGLRVWVALLRQRIERPDDTPSGVAYA